MDKRSIYDIDEYKFSGEKLNQILPIIFKQKVDNKRGIGVSAQDLNEIEPLLVKRYGNGSIDVDYEKLSVLLLSVVKDLNERLQVLENNMKPKKNKNAKL